MMKRNCLVAGCNQSTISLEIYIFQCHRSLGSYLFVLHYKIVLVSRTSTIVLYLLICKAPLTVHCSLCGNPVSIVKKGFEEGEGCCRKRWNATLYKKHTRT